MRDVGRVLEMPYADADKVAKLVPNQLNITLEQALETEPRLRELVDTDPKVRELMTIARSLEGESGMNDPVALLLGLLAVPWLAVAALILGMASP